MVKYGRPATYTFAPDEGYAIANVKINGKSVGAVSEYSFSKLRPFRFRIVGEGHFHFPVQKRPYCIAEDAVTETYKILYSSVTKEYNKNIVPASGRFCRNFPCSAVYGAEAGRPPLTFCDGK